MSVNQTRIIIRPLGAVVLLSGIAALGLLAVRPRTHASVPAVVPSDAVKNGRSVAPTPSPFGLVNGSMEAGGTAPDGWSVGYVGEGRLVLERDTNNVREGAASLRLASFGHAPAYGTVSQTLTETAGKTIRFTGWARAGGEFKEALVALRVRTAKEKKQVAWENLAVMSSGDGQWRPVDRTLTLPPNTVASVEIVLNGKGRLWVDALDLVAVTGEAAKSAPVAGQKEDAPSPVPDPKPGS
jgi:hypothetical protein